VPAGNPTFERLVKSLDRGVDPFLPAARPAGERIHAGLELPDVGLEGVDFLEKSGVIGAQWTRRPCILHPASPPENRVRMEDIAAPSA